MMLFRMRVQHSDGNAYISKTLDEDEVSVYRRALKCEPDAFLEFTTAVGDIIFLNSIFVKNSVVEFIRKN